MERTSLGGLTRLAFYTPDYKTFFEDYVLEGDQLKFTSEPLDALKICDEDPGRYPVVILFNDEPAGFFVLHGQEGVKEYWENDQALLLRAFSVNPKYQGKGIAQKSMMQLPEFVKEHFSGVNEVILAVNCKNVAAQHVYKKTGFIDKGVRAWGRNGEMFILHLDL
ncbi:GNAT family N-acetyltransferase [Neobacillus sp. LXY-1]|uniref:GNAT family N-acetyltransferase n=1 Tax=Neobacillus sp. LXY-1 TaxID=3379133 RepID=UPI003EDEDDA8